MHVSPRPRGRSRPEFAPADLAGQLHPVDLGGLAARAAIWRVRNSLLSQRGADADRTLTALAWWCTKLEAKRSSLTSRLPASFCMTGSIVSGA